MHTILPGHDLSIVSVSLTLDGCPVFAVGQLVTITATCNGKPFIDCVRLQGMRSGRIIVNGCLENISICSDNLPAGHKIQLRCH